MDYSTKQGAAHLCGRIDDYWTQRGRNAKARPKRTEMPEGYSGAVNFEVNSRIKIVQTSDGLWNVTT